MKTKLLIIFLLFACNYISAQTPVADSLHQEIFNSRNDKQKLAAILKYCDQYQSLNRDTAYEYAMLAQRMANQTRDAQTIARACLAVANAYFVWGWVDSADAACDTALQNCRAADASTREVYYKLMRQKAMCYGSVEKFPQAFDVLYKLLREAEMYTDSITIASTCNTIGSVNILMEKPGEALRWIRKALLYKTNNAAFLPIQASILINAAYAYMILSSADSALHYINAALPLCRQAQNLNILATALRIRSKLCVSLHKNSEAEKDLREMLAIRRLLNGGSYSSLIDDNIQLAHFYAGSGQIQKAINFCKANIKSGESSKQTDSVSFNNHLSTRLEYYTALAGFYKQAGMGADYTATLEQIIIAKDSFYAANSAQAIADVQTKYETEQKEKTILQQKYDLAKKNFLLISSLALLCTSALMFWLLFREYRRRQRIKMEMVMQKEQMAKQFAIKEAEEKERRRIAADLHDNLGVQANAILYNAELLKNESEGSKALIDDLHDTAKQMLLNLRETLWAMKTHDIAAAGLWVRIIGFCKQMGRHYSHIRFITQGMPPGHMHLASANALHVVMMIQEAVHNAIRHSEATVIMVSSDITESQWQIAIHDNGNGFAFEEAFAKKDSYGLQNMQERALAGNVAITINSQEAAGTTIQLLVSNKNLPIIATE